METCNKEKKQRKIGDSFELDEKKTTEFDYE
jgi:hypothetical protein